MKMSTFSMSPLIAALLSLALPVLSLSSASAEEYYPLYSGQSVNYGGYTFACNAPMPAPQPEKAYECKGTVTITLPGYIGHQPTKDVQIVGDSSSSKLDALANLRANCASQLAKSGASNVDQFCSGLAEGEVISCKRM